MLLLLGNYDYIAIHALNLQDFSPREHKFRSCRIRRRKSQHFDSSNEDLNNIVGDGRDVTANVANNFKRLEVEDISLLEPPPDYEVS